MKTLLLVSLTFALAACSGSKPAAESADAGIELADAVEFSEESEDVVAENLESDPLAEPVADPMSDPLAEPVGEEAMAPVAEEQAPVEVEPLMESPMPSAPEFASYTVKENETLMMIAFQLYGDYSRWRELAKLNEEKLGGSTVIAKGMELKHKVPEQPFVFNPEGNPYLIVEGDTLGKISSKTYGQPVFWKEIWHNNKPLIKDPNVIFAGFTIYTPFLQGRDVAFDKQ